MINVSGSFPFHMRYARLDALDRGLEALRENEIVVVGGGATGSRMLEQLARMGADLKIVDRDFLEESNLATSALYTEEQVEDGLPKAVAAAERLERINTEIRIDADVADLNRGTADDLLGSADLVLDGTDNMETRFLLNEYCVKNRAPWVHVSALGTSGEAMPIVPRQIACFNCVFAGVDGSSLATCETAGILPAAASTAASLGVEAAVGILQGEPGEGLARFDLSTGDFSRLAAERRDDCGTCSRKEFPYLDGDQGSATTAVCGEDTYQVNPSDGNVDLAALAEELGGAGAVAWNEHLLRFNGEEEFTVFRDGRMIVEAEGPERARSIYSRFVGN